MKVKPVHVQPILPEELNSICFVCVFELDDVVFEIIVGDSIVKSKYAQSAYYEFGFQRVSLKQTLNSKGWEFSCP